MTLVDQLIMRSQLRKEGVFDSNIEPKSLQGIGTSSETKPGLDYYDNKRDKGQYQGKYGIWDK